MKKDRQKLVTLADLFVEGDTYLSAPDSAALKSAVIQAVHRKRDEPVILKYWRKTGSAVDKDLSDIWRHEVRQAERIRAFPGAHDLTVEVLENGETEDAFFTVIAAGLEPLEYVLRHARPNHWLKGLASRRHRSILWWNIRRIASALGAVHSQGAFHGRIGPGAIFTRGSVEADFRLGGFEWCVRIAEIDSAPIGAVAARRGTPLIFSFTDDWQALGRLIVDIIGLDKEQLDAEDFAFRDGVAAFDLEPSELDLIR